MSEAPPSSVLHAFGAHAEPARFTFGRGRTWAAGDLVLKSVDDQAEAEWIAELAATVHQDGFRLSKPVRARDGRWIVAGWSAWTRVAGEHSTTRWPELLAAASAFHRAIAHVPKPEFIDRRVDRWRTADRIAWDERPLGDLAEVPQVRELVAARRPVALTAQLAHCDLVGNVLFADGLPPALIDLSLYWRPAAYSSALVVGDALTWEGASPDIVRLIEPLPEWPQVLLRAVLFRILVNELARRAEPSRADLSAEYRPIVERVLALVSRSSV